MTYYTHEDIKEMLDNFDKWKEPIQTSPPTPLVLESPSIIRQLLRENVLLTKIAAKKDKDKELLEQQIFYLQQENEKLKRIVEEAKKFDKAVSSNMDGTEVVGWYEISLLLKELPE